MTWKQITGVLLGITTVGVGIYFLTRTPQVDIKIKVFDSITKEGIKGAVAVINCGETFQTTTEDCGLGVLHTAEDAQGACVCEGQTITVTMDQYEPATKLVDECGKEDPIEIEMIPIE